jgi:hypothetical protein
MNYGLAVTLRVNNTKDFLMIQTIVNIWVIYPLTQRKSSCLLLLVVFCDLEISIRRILHEVNPVDRVNKERFVVFIIDKDLKDFSLA